LLVFAIVQRQSSPPLHSRRKLGRRQKAASLSLFCYFVCVLLRPSSPSLCVRDIIVSLSLLLVENNLLSFGQDIDPESGICICATHTRS
jgi:hypothetical protein